MNMAMRLAHRARQAREGRQQPDTRATHASMMASIHRIRRQAIRAAEPLREERMARSS